MEFSDINWLAIVVATLAPLAVGFVWYGPLFGKAWQKETGISDEELKKGNYPLIFGLSTVFAFFIAFMIWAMVLTGGGAGEIHGQDPYLTFKHGSFHGLLLAVFVILPVIGTIALYERKSFKYVFITVGYWAVSFAIMGGILNVWL